MKLLKRIREQGFHSSIVANFSCDLPFYETLIQARLRSVRCLNNIFLTDSHNYLNSIPSIGRLATGAGRRYTVVPVTAHGAFHPKLFLQLGEKKGRLLIGSANVSTGGFGSNRELVSEIVCTDEKSTEQSLVAQVYDYLVGFIDNSVHSFAYKLDLITRDTSWLENAERTNDPFDLGDGRLVALLFTPESSIVSRFEELVQGDHIKRLVALAPFWDPNLKAFSELVEVLKPDSAVILIQPETVNISLKKLKQIPVKVDVIDVGWSKERYLHAKLILAQGEHADHIITGSANCSVAALGLKTASAINAETCVYQRQQAGTAAEALSIADKLSSGKALKAQQMKELQWKDERPSGPGPLNPGHFEASGNRILWWPNSKVPASGASVELLDANLMSLGKPIDVEKTGAPSVFKPDNVSSETRFARIITLSKEITAPAILHVQEDLRRAAPGISGAKFHDLLKRIHIGESEFLELLEPFEKLIFKSGTEKNKQKDKGSKGKSPASPSEDPIETVGTLNYEEFLQGRCERTSGEHDLIAAAGTDLSLFVDFLIKYFSQIDEEGDQDWLTDDEEDEETGEPLDKEPTPPKKKPPVCLSDHALKKTRYRVNKLINRYIDWATKAQKDRKKPVSADDIATLWALIAILSYLFGKPIQLENRKKTRIIPINNPESANDFPNIVNSVLGNFFTAGVTPLINRLQIPEIFNVLPAEYFGTWCSACWAVCVGMELAMRFDIRQLQEDLEVLGYTIYSKTGISEGKIDGDAIAKRLSHIHEMVDLETELPEDRLIDWHNWFLNISNCSPPAGWKPSNNKKMDRNIQIGDRVWAYKAGPRYVRKIKDGKLCLNKPGEISKSEDENYYMVVTGYATPIDASPSRTKGDILE